FKIPNFLLSVLLITGLYLTNFNYINLFDDLVIILLIHFIYYLFQNQIGYGDIKLFCVLTLITLTLMFSFIVYFFFFFVVFFLFYIFFIILLIFFIYYLFQNQIGYVDIKLFFFLT